MEEIILKKICKICNIPISVYDNQNSVFSYPDHNKFSLNKKTETFQFIDEVTKEQEVPVLLQEDENIYFGAIRDSKDKLILLGPVSRNPVSEAISMKYCHKHHLGHEFIIHRMEIKTVMEILSFLTYLETGEEIPVEKIQTASQNDSIFRWNSLAEEEQYQLEQSEIEWDHNSIEFENRLMQTVRDGDIDAMNRIIRGTDNLDTEHVGIVAQNAAKQAEYLTVTLISLMARAAAQGGMKQERAYSLADIYLQRLEKSKNIQEMYALATKAEYEFTLCVRQSKEENSNVLYIEQCKEYIAKNLRKPIQVGDIAPAIGINRSYLARRFSEVEGITIQNYIMKERCAHAANMLKFSNYSIALIAEYFCFSSQSHFGRNFKQFYGMTPKEYRNKHQQTIVF
ncbi:hypothetical protein GCM10008910_00910 [Faecalicatena orotica]|uniref:AraC-like DNA-binding protein n=1 Tax=Faecalicatena orotica TaxID=1544 RepID=A0A2Y9BLM6_9FIRM|nr:helix-turn-helix domain-containing protein [Faecalicatena orotica]PWJ21530.1 AraC-like DNA-binding protein [Faecalicatena orotica]SSA58340.1 AraC-type DNA-binding protein [Faecalicatena orotica]